MSEMPKRFIVAGITGGVASGKSSLCSMLRARGAVVIDLDQVAREVTSPGSPVTKSLAEAFGKDILGSSGELDRRKLAEKAFSRPDNVKTLNRLTHPPIAAELKRKLEGLRAAGYDGVVAVEAALFVEGGDSRRMLDALVAVTCADSARERRLSAQGGDRGRDLLRRRRLQLSDEQKAEQADYVIDNDGTLEDLENEARELWEWLVKIKEERTGDSG
jgi:dephospho-CoA kinase